MTPTCACGHLQTVHTGGGRADGGLCFPTGTTRHACPCEHFRTRYPTTADLAALRTLGMSAPSIMADPRATGTMRAWIVAGRWQMHPHVGAWPDELRDGIGFRYPGDRSDRAPLDAERIDARREAAALRSRAFGYHPDAFGAVPPGAMACEREHGTPTAAWESPDWWDCNR